MQRSRRRKDVHACVRCALPKDDEDDEDDETDSSSLVRASFITVIFDEGGRRGERQTVGDELRQQHDAAEEKREGEKERERESLPSFLPSCLSLHTCPSEAEGLSRCGHK